MTADILLLADKKEGDDDHGFPEKAGEFRKIATAGFDVALLIAGLVFKEVPGAGAVLWLLGKANTANKNAMDATLDQYLHAVTDSINAKSTALADKMNTGFQQLTSQLVDTDYKQVVHDRAAILASNLQAVLAAVKEKNEGKIKSAIDDYANTCARMPPIDVLYALYKRLSKSRSDLNFVWTNLTTAEYHHAAFKPWKEQVEHTVATLVYAHILYISLRYEKDRSEENAYSRDDENEIRKLMKIAQDIMNCLETIDTQRQEVCWPKYAEIIAAREIPKGGEHDKNAEERTIFNLQKNFGVWYDFIAIRFTNVVPNKNINEAHEWKLETHDDLKYTWVTSGDIQCVILRIPKSVKINGNPEEIFKEINSKMEESSNTRDMYITLDQTVDYFKKIDKSEPWFAFALHYRPDRGTGVGKIGEQKLSCQATISSRISHRTYVTSHSKYVGRAFLAWKNNYEVFISNTK